MVEFIFQPFHVTKNGVQFQIFVDSATRKHGFVGINTLTRDEWEALRNLIEAGAKAKVNKDKVAVDIHLAFEKVD